MIKTTSPYGEARGRGRPQVPAETLNVFLSVLADTLHVGKAAARAGVDPSTMHHLRARDPEFAAAWKAAMAGLPARVGDALIEEAIEGTPIFNEKGVEVGRRRSQRLLERLGEQHGLLPSSRTAVAVQVVNGNGEPQVTFSDADRQRISDLLHGRLPPAGNVIEGEIATTPDDGSDLV